MAGVPRATLVVILATAATFHLPLEPVAMILGVDVLMDMARTMVNVVGNCLASAVVAKWEGEFGTEPASEARAGGALKPRAPPLPPSKTQIMYNKRFSRRYPAKTKPAKDLHVNHVCQRT